MTTRNDIVQRMEEWRLSIPGLRGGVIRRFTKALEKRARPGEIDILSVVTEEGWARIAFDGRPWGLLANGVATPFAGEWRIELHDLTGPMGYDGRLGRQERGTVAYRTVPYDTDWIDYGVPRLLKWMRGKRPDPKMRFTGALPCRGPFIVVEHEAWVKPATDYSPKILEITLTVRDREWAVYCTRAESRRVTAFLGWLLLGYDPPDDLLLLEHSPIGDMMMRQVPSRPKVWSAWRDSSLWTMNEVWTVGASALAAKNQ